MSYHAIDDAAQGKSVVGVLFGAAIGAAVGAICLAVAGAVVPTNLYSATTVRPAIAASTTAPVNTRTMAQTRSFAVAQPYATSQSQIEDTIVQAPQAAVYSWAFVLFAAVAGAVNGLFLWNRRAAMAATTGRREALMSGVAAVGLTAGPALAAYGEGANIFGKPKDVEQFREIEGDGWSTIIPGKYNDSKEIEAAGQVGRWEDNFDAVNNTAVFIVNGNLGSLDEVRNNVITPLLGKQAFEGPSLSEGGFAPGRYGAAAILDQSEESKNGKTYYYYEILTRTADNNEGGRHQLFAVTASNGKLYILKAQAGDKRWFKGADKGVRASIASFKVR